MTGAEAWHAGHRVSKGPGVQLLHFLLELIRHAPRPPSPLLPAELTPRLPPSNWTVGAARSDRGVPPIQVRVAPIVQHASEEGARKDGRSRPGAWLDSAAGRLVLNDQGLAVARRRCRWAVVVCAYSLTCSWSNHTSKEHNNNNNPTSALFLPTSLFASLFIS